MSGKWVILSKIWLTRCYCGSKNVIQQYVVLFVTKKCSVEMWVWRLKQSAVKLPEIGQQRQCQDNRIKSDKTTLGNNIVGKTLFKSRLIKSKLIIEFCFLSIRAFLKSIRFQWWTQTWRKSQHQKVGVIKESWLPRILLERGKKIKLVG